MNIVEILVGVHPEYPKWIQHEKTKYRIYLDDELMIERVWYWDINTYLNERIIADLPKDSTHLIKLDVLKTIPGAMSEISLKNLTVNGVIQEVGEQHNNKVSFTVA